MRDHVLSLLHALPDNIFGRKLAILLRRPLKYGKTEEYTIEVWGMELVLRARGNASESHLLFTPQFYQTAERGFIQSIVSAGEPFTFFDVGSNIGAYSYWVHSVCPLRSTIHAIEANPVLSQRIEDNFSRNGAEGVTVHSVGVSDQEGTMTLAVNHSNAGESRLIEGKAEGQSEVPVKRLSKLVEETGVEKIDLLKVDIEGFEQRVLRELFENASEALYPKYLICEYKDDEDHVDLLQLLDQYEYRELEDFGLNRIYGRE